MQIHVLGPLRVTLGDAEVPISSARKPRLLLALLAAHAGRTVSWTMLTSALWGGSPPPPSARRNIQLYAHRLRRVLGPEVVVATAAGYVLAATEAVDAVRFHRLAEQGRAADCAGKTGAALGFWRHALDLWHGPALAEFDDCASIAGKTHRWEELWLDVFERWANAQVRTGNPSAVIPELAELVQVHPYRESLYAVLMRALYRAGRQADALTAFRRARAQLVEQLGIEPNAELRRLQEAILRADDASVFQRAPLGAAA